MKEEKKGVKIIDTTLRDAHQSLLATRMKTEDMLPIAESLNKVGYFSVEMWGGATFDSCMRFLHEDPWERIRLLKKAMPDTKLQMLLRGQNLVGYRHYADDVVEKFVETAAKWGIDIFRIFDALNDIRNLKTAIKATKNVGKHTQGCIAYTISPVHNISLYIDLCKQFEDLGCDSICIKDMAGLLTPYVAYELVSEIKNAVKLPIDLHCHYTSGMACATYTKAIEAGVDIVDTAISSLALSTSQPATETIVAILKDTPYDPGLDLNLLSEIAKYFTNIRKKYKEFETQFSGVDVQVLTFQIPGGMWSNMEKQLKDQNALDRLPEVLEELPRVRKDMGYPPLVTPTSQIVGTQAVLNVIAGERYKIITKETREYLKGNYGKPPGEVNPELLKLALGDEELIKCRPADLIKPEFENIKKELGDKAKITEDVLTYALFPEVATKLFEAREKPLKVEEKFPKVELPKREEPKKEEVTPPRIEASGVGRFRVKVGDKSYEVEVEEIGYAPTIKSVKEYITPPVTPAKELKGNEVKSPFQGDILKINCKVGDIVKRDDVLILMEAMKMEIQIKAPSSGEILNINVFVGDKVKAGDVLVVISSKVS